MSGSEVRQIYLAQEQTRMQERVQVNVEYPASDGSVTRSDCPLVLSLFPGIGLLDMAFEAEGFCVVRGPDLLWGGDIHRFHPPAGRFDGVIGGPPCQAHSHLGNVVARAAGDKIAVDLIPEFVRCVNESEPDWFVMENVPQAPSPTHQDYIITRYLLDNRLHCGGEQHRERVFSFGRRHGDQGMCTLPLDWWAPAIPFKYRPTVTANATIWKDGRAYGDKSERYYRGEMLPAQGLPDDFLAVSPFTVAGKIKMVGNGVPLPMGRAVARAVKAAISAGRVTEPTPTQTQRVA